MFSWYIIIIIIIMPLNIVGRKIKHDAVLVYYSCEIRDTDSATNGASAARRVCFGVKGYPIVLAFQFPAMLEGFMSEIRAQYRGVTTRPKKAATRNTVCTQQSRLTSCQPAYLIYDLITK